MAKQTTRGVLFKNYLRDTSLSLSYIAYAMRPCDASSRWVLFEFGSFQRLLEVPLMLRKTPGNRLSVVPLPAGRPGRSGLFKSFNLILYTSK